MVESESDRVKDLRYKVSERVVRTCTYPTLVPRGMVDVCITPGF